MRDFSFQFSSDGVLAFRFYLLVLFVSTFQFIMVLFWGF